jgi:hypothetical protein
LPLLAGTHVKSLFVFTIIVFSTFTFGQSQNYSADTIFEKFSNSIFQVKIIDINSGSQSSIGTGFVVAEGKQLATNYHVISALVHKPEQYRAEILIDNTTQDLEIIGFDVIHDLAVLKAKSDTHLGEPIPISLETLSKGRKLYSIGNPHDIGMTVVEGTYNGLVDHQFIESIHFSGSINPGMSGGPTINEAGSVVGINVATSGEQIGFLVPADKLHRLIVNASQMRDLDHYELMGQQIAEYTDGVIDNLLATNWITEPMGNAQVVGKLSDNLGCWGNSQQKEEVQLEIVSKGCSNKDHVYISRAFSVGYMEYEYQYTKNENWNSMVFYNFMTQQISGARPGNRANKESVNDFSCKTDIVKNEGNPLKKKINYCVRDYKKIPGLYDVFYIGMTINKKNEAMMEHYTLSGVTENSASRFLERFIGTLQWQ